MRSDSAGAEHNFEYRPHHGEQAKNGADPFRRLHGRAPYEIGGCGEQPDDASHSNNDERAALIRSEGQQEN
jgi:hypothetical protein